MHDLWRWHFPGGHPSRSFLKNPKVRYNTPGNYDVILITNNANGSDTLSFPILGQGLCGHLTSTNALRGLKPLVLQDFGCDRFQRTILTYFPIGCMVLRLRFDYEEP